MAQKDKITIAGAGLVGSLLSIILAKKGYQVDIYERRPDLRSTIIDGGRSINLALSDRGWKALKIAGIEDEIVKNAIPMKGRVIHDVEGKTNFQPYGEEGQAIYSVSRSGLNALLMDEAEKTGKVNIHFNEKCDDVDLESAKATFKNYESGASAEVQSDLLLGTDGAFSAVRAAMQKTDRFSYSQEYIEHGYKELNIPPGKEGAFLIEKNALHIWPRGHYMLIALPNPDGSFTCTLFFPFEGEGASFEALDSVSKARAFFETHFADALALMPDFDKDWAENPTSSLVIIRCFPWSRNGKVALLGDASHAIVPFYGQGMNSGFEDCSVFDALLDEFSGDWNRILPAFEKSRKPNADAIADLAMRNFIEMRDLTGDPEFILRKKIESWFHSKHPERWIPLYSMVTFTDISYADALEIGRKQDKIMQVVMQMPEVRNDFAVDAVEQRIIAGMKEYNLWHVN